jgi:uncharacterized protein
MREKPLAICESTAFRSKRLRRSSLIHSRRPDHSADEGRFVTFGVSSAGRLLVVAHADEDDIIRVINARKVTHGEKRLYEKG